MHISSKYEENFFLWPHHGSYDSQRYSKGYTLHGGKNLLLGRAKIITKLNKIKYFEFKDIEMTAE